MKAGLPQTRMPHGPELLKRYSQSLNTWVLQRVRCVGLVENCIIVGEDLVGSSLLGLELDSSGLMSRKVELSCFLPGIRHSTPATSRSWDGAMPRYFSTIFNDL